MPLPQLGADGWLTLSWPAEFGGRDATVTDQLIFTDEAAVVRVNSCGLGAARGFR